MTDNTITDAILHYWKLGRKTKITPSGWISANAVCCSRRGEKSDTRQRGGMHTIDGGGISYSCFNCGFKAAWQPGRNINGNMKQLLSWIGMPDAEISKLALESLRLSEGIAIKNHVLLQPDFDTCTLPEDAKPIASYAEPSRHLQRVIDYLKSRSFALEDYNFCWSPQLKFRNRLIVPFYYQDRLVGWTSRTVDPNDKIKYVSDQQPGYVFNTDAQNFNRVFCIVVEGPLDAIHIDAAALCGSSVNEQQAYQLNSLNRQIIVLPDRDSAGSKLVEQAIEQGWSVSFPNWDRDINDVGDAVQRYGRLYTLYSIVSCTETSPLKIRLAAKRWFKE
jgi:hypothetical protein